MPTDKDSVLSYEASAALDLLFAKAGVPGPARVKLWIAGLVEEESEYVYIDNYVYDSAGIC